MIYLRSRDHSEDARDIFPNASYVLCQTDDKEKCPQKVGVVVGNEDKRFQQKENEKRKDSSNGERFFLTKLCRGNFI